MLNLPKLIGHRGVKNLSPENTLESIKLSKKYRLDWVEIDVKISKDLIPILFHDDNLDRTTNGKGLPIDYDFLDLKKLDAGKFFYKKNTKISIPSLEEALNLCYQSNINLNIEIKPNLGFEEKNVEAIAKLIKSFDFKNKFYFSSFDWDSIILMKKLMPEAYYGLLIDDFNIKLSLENILNFCKDMNIFCCGFDKKVINVEIINKLINENIFVNIFSDNNISLSEANELWCIGVKSIFIDNPSEFKFINH